MFHNGSTYDYHFIIKELAEQFEGEFECLGENTKKYITFSVPIKKEITKKDKNGNDKITKISYKIKFMIVADLCQHLYQILLVIYLKSFIVTSVQIINLYMTIKGEQLIFRCFECKKNYKKDFNEELINRFLSTFEF